MRDRSKKLTQRGRYLSTEAMQVVESLKRVALRGGPAASAAAALEPKLRRLVKADVLLPLSVSAPRPAGPTSSRPGGSRSQPAAARQSAHSGGGVACSRARNMLDKMHWQREL